ncbi:hypothetical protein CS022_05060 [Veronia nyctiphanis]|uniref:Uncharacterized protein n=1 Tax=Veronia nyctiphanis TaxID=1278244 RepID=A0A4Q0YV01_9GAMM|nr:hypothetical protein [Veronia nyctiphanis]RXJ74024.1 hypothetical protein CS022_05060 [Veronia nyctiphanis]
MFKNMSLRAKILLGNGLTLLFLVMLSVIALNGIKNLNETDMWVNHTHEVINTARQIEAQPLILKQGNGVIYWRVKSRFSNPTYPGKKNSVNSSVNSK